MLTPQINSIAEIMRFLGSVAGVTAQVGTRIYGPPGIPNGVALQKMLLVDSIDEPNELGVPLFDGEFQVRCWGATIQDAWAVYMAVNEAMHRTGVKMWVGLNGGTVIMYQCRKTAGPFPTIDDSVLGDEWPYVIARYTARLAENEV